ncbi:response regulator [Spirosoma pollinicola]|nr:response regulator [Spirosoma pollinicola]
MIDDDADDYYLLSTVIKANYPEHDVMPIYDSSQALSQLEALRTLPAFLLLDLNMPVKNGFEILREMRSLTRYESLPIIIFTSSANPKDLTRCRELGATDYIEKPTSYKELHLVIEKTLRLWLNTSA